MVDDQPINIQAAYNILSDRYTVLAATSAETAVDTCNDNLPDLILLDVVMREMSGLQLCELLKQDAKKKWQKSSSSLCRTSRRGLTKKLRLFLPLVKPKPGQNFWFRLLCS